MTGLEAVVGAIGAAVSTAAPYVAVASAALGAASAISAGEQRAETDRRNQAIAKNNAALSLNEGESDAARQQRQTRRNIAAQANAFAGNGVDIASGSPLDVMADTAANGALDSEITRWRAATKSNAYLDRSAEFAAQAPVDQLAGYGTAATTLLTAGARFGKARAAPTTDAS